jgi:hypothetical protein
MKLTFASVWRNLFAVISLSTLVVNLANAADKDQRGEFPFNIAVEVGASEFGPGDGIVITSLKGDRENLEAGGHYLVEGTYTLSSADEADLAFFLTSRGLAGSTSISDEEHVFVSRGSGKFSLQKTLLGEGWPHLTFYVRERPHGGVYFGEKGNESTVLRKKSWSDFAQPPGTATWGNMTEANRAIMAYLGEPVQSPAGLDPKYSASSVLNAFKKAVRAGGFEIRSLAVDETEFPFLVYGLVAGKHEYPEFEKAITKVKGYVYGGSVVGGDDRATHLAFNITPSEQYPDAQAQACHRRLMIRLQMLSQRARQSL